MSIFDPNAWRVDISNDVAERFPQTEIGESRFMFSEEDTVGSADCREHSIQILVMKTDSTYSGFANNHQRFPKDRPEQIKPTVVLRSAPRSSW